MPETDRIPIFDGHNDTLTRIRGAEGNGRRSFLDRSSIGHLDLPRAREGGMVGGFFAIFSRSRRWSWNQVPLLDEQGSPVPDGWAVPLPPKLDRRQADRWTVAVMSDLFRLVDRAAGEIAVVRTASELSSCIDDGRFAVVLHIEGAEAIDTRLEALDVLHQAGLRSLGPVWSRPNAFGHGVPFAFPRHPDTGPGLTPAGRRLVNRCNELGIMIDLSHLNEQGFWDVTRISDAPLVATHSNAYALCPSPRNLTDAQLDVIALSGGVVGLNYAVGFLREDGGHDPTTPIGEIAKHARYIADRIGVDHVALGSDFDGAVIPEALGDAAGLQRLVAALGEVGFDEEEVRLIAYRNWLRVLRKTWGS
jgi:membrane dipeptidase